MQKNNIPKVPEEDRLFRYVGDFEGKNVLITGGMGFIGSNLAIRLAGMGAKVVLLDAMIPDYGGNLFNIKPVESMVTVNFGDIRNDNTMNYLVKEKDYIFHLAGQVCHVMSLTNPFPDIDINIKGAAVLMEACKKNNPGVKVIYTGTRGQYGPSVHLPVNEEAPTRPKGIYEISNLAAEQIIKVYNDIHGIKSVMLRLTNIYGPRAQMQHHRFGVVNWFIRQAMDDETLKIFGDGKILRDFLFVNDCVDAIIMSAATPEAYGEIFNVGIDRPTNFIELAEAIIKVAGKGKWEFAPFSAERKAQEPGDFYSDISKIKRIIGWEPKIGLEDGLRGTISYYEKQKKYYW
ncbi:MAG: NAD-dependent epimerase/dehydratase family protein [Candidatus Omnitrophica bacterium]|nr:NAD-dependent epimerase/dehydratase family protein [Candidatus Omnitrophota bacterium]MDD5553400.1 NAD-dependent epimerase/dehydratase family protein [Candidatus Omnitrophota bacterium]